MDEAWRRFEISGKVTDYLKCKHIHAGETNKDTADSRKERPDGAEYRSDRNGLKCNADWRI